MKNKMKRDNLVFMITGALAFLNIFFLIFRYMRGECVFQDFHARWQESAYLLRGINPFDALAGKVTIDSIGAIDPTMVTVPWAWILGTIINPGFLSFEMAKIWGMFMYFVICSATAFLCYRYVSKYYFTEKTENITRWGICAAFIVLSQYCWVWSFMCGNHGALACCFVVMAICVYKEHPYLAGVLMTFGMIKPQIAALFFITFLVLKQYKIIITAAVLGIAVMLVTCGITGVGIFELLTGTGEVGTNLNYVFFGLFNMLKYNNVSTSVILALDIVMGLVYLIMLTLMAKKQEDGSGLKIFMGATIASTFWFYKQSHDYVILILPCLMLLYGMHRVQTKQFVYKLVLLTAFVVIFYAQSASRKVVSMVIQMPEQFGKELFMTFTCIAFMIMGVLAVRAKEE